MLLKTERNHAVDFLKGICVLFVIITHCAWSDAERLTFLFPFWIDMAVPMFMILSGYVSTLSLMKKDVQHLDECYSLRGITTKLLRFVLPFLLPFAFGQWVFFTLDNHAFSWRTLLNAFLNGGHGPGAYYVPVMVQFVFVFPLIFFVVKHLQWKGVVLCGIANFAFELIKESWHMEVATYRLLFFRYVFVVAFGCRLAMSTLPKKPWLWLGLFVAGAGYILTFVYNGVEPFVTNMWTGTSMFASMFLLSIAGKLVTCRWLKNPIIEYIGKASYNIFLVQMAYFTVSRFVLLNVESRVWQVAISIVVCVVAGVLYYLVEAPTTAFITKKVCSFRWSKKTA